ncbi:MAG: hypothetical protein NTW59_01200 [Candidatus Diapherotrites archaeon]|nr:hypothetical protein [Candidatus Diapherotrites archaeon]
MRVALPRMKYPRLLLLALAFIVASLLFAGGHFSPVHNILVSLGFFGSFLAGFLYAYDFTAVPAAAILLLLAKEQNIWAATLVAGAGALLSDIIIFLFLRYEVMNEIEELEKSRYAKIIEKEEEKLFGRFQKYFLLSLAAILIASPLPTEIGITMLASIKTMSTKKFAGIVYLLHSAGIFAILLTGSLI